MYNLGCCTSTPSNCCSCGEEDSHTHTFHFISFFKKNKQNTYTTTYIHTHYTATTTMPGPKMGTRPDDFDEDIVRQAPTFMKWLKLQEGQKLRYACRDFIKGHGDDEERLMRRIMIARRNNLRDHETLKRARQTARQTSRNSSGGSSSSKTKKRKTTPSSSHLPPLPPPSTITTQPLTTTTTTASSNSNSPPTTSTTPTTSSTTATAAIPSPTTSTTATSSSSSSSTTTGMTDAQVAQEMDVPAVEATRSYRQWQSLAMGEEFCYNQKYTKGKDGHDWLLRKNIWRRMRYRRENKKMIERLKGIHNNNHNNNNNNNNERDNVNHRWVLQCSFPEIGKVTICPTPNIVEEISYEFDDKTSTNFLCLALALRYRAPIVLETWEDGDSSTEGASSSSANFIESQEELNENFPLFKTVESLKDQSNRVHENIERGFEIQKLTGALRIAMEKGDKAAASMIQEKLDQFDSLDELPTIPDDFGMDEMQ
mmetsp:Transcript_4125/g.6035  ORF Transcript_4125/g.6035 Transcript_4125/m.6035 type:complete len:482 (+) Transcript_4125:189-1634(+)